MLPRGRLVNHRSPDRRVSNTGVATGFSGAEQQPEFGPLQVTDDALFGCVRLPIAIWRDVIEAPSRRILVDSVKVLFVLEGWATLRSRADLVVLQPGTVVVLPARHAYSISPDSPIHVVALHLRPSFLEAHLDWFPRSHPLLQKLYIAHLNPSIVGVLNIGAQGVQEMRGRLILLEALSGQPGAEFAILARLAEVFDQMSVHLFRDACTNAEHIDNLRAIPRLPVTRAMRALHEQLDRAWTVGELAREAAISESQLTRLFRRYLGVSPAVYLWRVRTDRMADLLICGDTNVSEASRSVGWKHSSSAGRAFKRRYGMSPRHFVLATRTVDVAGGAAAGEAVRGEINSRIIASRG